MATKQSIFEEHLDEWLKARKDKKRRGEILAHIVFTAKVHPKSVPRSFKRVQMKDSAKEERRGRKTYYTPDVLFALKDVWDTGDRACGELLHPQIREYVEVLKRDGMWSHPTEATNKLLKMSECTVKRKTGRLAKTHGENRGRSSTKPSSLKSIIPIFKGPWKELPPGHGQLDTVAHCGDTLLGDFIYTVNYTDSATYWTIIRAQWNKGQHATVESMKEIRKRLPFPWIMGHPDTGGEFINRVAKDWFEKEGIKLTRSEPGKKNDNMYVEERNGHVIRKYLGYARLDNMESLSLVNELCETLELYTNHWKAVKRQVKKERVGAKYVRIYEKKAKTPYTRVMERDDITEEIKQHLRDIHGTLNPLVLKRRIDTLITMILKMNSHHE
ncbi:MAG: hypothetical protein ABII13_05875 [Patescibacteria group bacterium]